MHAMTLECKIFIWKALDYAHHFSPLSVTKPYTMKNNGCSHCCTPLQICDLNPKQSSLFLGGGVGEKQRAVNFYIQEVSGLFEIDVNDLNRNKCLSAVKEKYCFTGVHIFVSYCVLVWNCNYCGLLKIADIH